MQSRPHRSLERSRVTTILPKHVHVAGGITLDSIPVTYISTLCMRSAVVDPSLHTAMSGCTLHLTRNTPLRTVLVDDATGQAKYQIDTPIRLVRSVTRIRKFDKPAQHPLRWDDGEFDSVDITDGGRKKKRRDSSEDITNVGVKKPKKDKKSKKYKKHKKCKKSEEDKVEEDKKDEGEEGKTDDEIARIYWKWFATDRFIFQGRARPRTEFLPRCGKMKTCVDFPPGVFRWERG